MYYDEEHKVKKSKSFWLYLTVILLYFLLIGIVIAVLLLAPKYPSLTSEVIYTPDPPPIIQTPLEEQPLDEDEPYFKKPFRPSPSDPLYTAIDPRSLHRNSTQNNMDRVKQNSKLLNWR